MRVFMQKPKIARQATYLKSTKPNRAFFEQNREESSIPHLQRPVGNQAVHWLLQNKTEGLGGLCKKRAEQRELGLVNVEGVQENHASRKLFTDYSQVPTYARAHGNIQSEWLTQNDDQRSTTTPPTLTHSQVINPPVSLTGEPRVTARPRLVAANSDHAIHLTVAEMEARALWQVDSTRLDVNNWAVGFYQALIPLDMHHCYEPLSRPPGPGSFPTSGPHWITRRQPIRTYEFDFLHTTRLTNATSGHPIEAVARDMPGVRHADAFVHPDADQPWARILESGYVADFYLQSVAINTVNNLFLPLWNSRWMVSARVGHRHPGAPSQIESFELSPFRAGVVSSEIQSVRGGHHGLVRGLSRPSPQNVGQWEPGCPSIG